MQITTLSNQVYQNRKAEAISNQIMRKEISLSELEVVDNNHIRLDGVTIELAEKAFKKLLGRLRIPSAFAKRFEDGFGQDGLRQLVQMMKQMKLSKKDQTVTLLVDHKEKKISDILPAGYASISNENFIGFAEQFIDQYNLDVTHMGSDPRGGVTINTVSPNTMLQIPGMKNELFHTGVTFRNTPDRGLEVSPFLNRLICTNGMTSTQFDESYGLHQLTDKNINEFNEHMLRLASTGFQPVGMAEQIRKASYTNASIQEVEQALNRVISSDKSINYDYMQRYIPIERITKAYEMKGVNTAELNAKQRGTANSGLTVWELVNGITNFASNDTKFAINDNTRGNLMVGAGNLLMKKEYDMEGLLTVNPFGQRNLLSEKESNRVMGNLN
jgi:translation initiation factor 2B subunit (eIF-2B alpha/beta/delta family)